MTADIRTWPVRTPERAVKARAFIPKNEEL